METEWRKAHKTNSQFYMKNNVKGKHSKEILVKVIISYYQRESWRMRLTDRTNEITAIEHVHFLSLLCYSTIQKKLCWEIRLSLQSCQVKWQDDFLPYWGRISLPCTSSSTAKESNRATKYISSKDQSKIKRESRLLAPGLRLY